MIRLFGLIFISFSVPAHSFTSFYIAGGAANTKIYSENAVIDSKTDQGWFGQIGKLSSSGKYGIEANYQRYVFDEEVPTALYPDAKSTIEFQDATFGFRYFTDYWITWSLQGTYNRIVRKLVNNDGVDINDSAVNFDETKFGGLFSMGLRIPVIKQMDLFADYYYQKNDLYYSHGAFIGIRFYTTSRKSRSK